ncbi:eight transmembrane protein EpsH [Candidatus Vecturithrix granuli]|uniref:Eight transmembrane protein EpsH n=1 Tax=Vecturithrix granuli TaxID=1499967 RepID=A0A081C3M1_VECG1|nr:eight transmembrane protein EpsH [Candidatus Vecturithrix granuli]
MLKKLGIQFYIAAALLIIGIVLTQWVPQGKSMPLQKDLLTFPDQLGKWEGKPHEPFDPKILEVLRVDDYLNRYYYNPEGQWISLYVGYFRDQMTGEMIHSPRNCLPGSGWNFTEMQNVTLEVPGNPSLKINAVRSVLISGQQRMLTYYWYQARGRFLTSEYWDRVYLVLDAMRYHRTDGALIRVLTPLPKEGSFEEIEAQMQDFILQFTPTLVSDYFPPAVG